MKVIELQANTLVELSTEVWATLTMPTEYIHGIGFVELVELPPELTARVLAECPWVSGKVAALLMQPNSHAPIHVDNHDDGKYYRSLNILIEGNKGNHKTFYYEYNGEWDMFKDGSLYGWDYVETDPNIKRVFEMTVTKPTVFWNQQFHNTENYDGVERTLLMWEIHKDVDPADITKWLADNNIVYNVLY